MKLKYTIKAKERKTIVVDETTHLLIMHYARKRGITIVQATFILLREALAEAEGVKLKDVDE